MRNELLKPYGGSEGELEVERHLDALKPYAEFMTISDLAFAIHVSAESLAGRECSEQQIVRLRNLVAKYVV